MSGNDNDTPNNEGIIEQHSEIAPGEQKEEACMADNQLQTAEAEEAKPAEDAISVPMSESQRILEALLFASDEILSPSKLKTILPSAPDARSIRKMVENINVQLQKQRHPFEIVEIGGGYQMRTISYYYPWIRQLFREKPFKRLSIQALECLAIIAYKQPITKAEIESIRGVESGGAIKTLLENHLVNISGRSEKPGRPLLYVTSQKFLEHFGLNKLSDLPQIEEFEALVKEKMEDLLKNDLANESGTVTVKENETFSETDQQNVTSQFDRPLDESLTQQEAMEIVRKNLEDMETVELSHEQDNGDNNLNNIDKTSQHQDPAG